MENAVHEIPPVWDENSKILILGSFPSVKSREGKFFYHHPQNRFWKVLAAVLECPVPQTVEEKRKMLLEHGIAVWDVIASCRIEGSSDSSIKDVVPNDLREILSGAKIEKIFVNGGTAFRMYEKYTRPITGKKAEKLPSTSPANAAWSLERLTGEWREKINFLHGK
ncbi:MAG: DNA-deoxyinosine glycosylase [Clostridiales bacterium]|nr:DNA-deoxyinosine glycosylase [Clostridiales bacterium]